MSSLPRDLLDTEELHQLLRACGQGNTGTRNRALIALMAATGLRVSEALALEARDIDLRRRRIHVRCGKGGKERRVWIDPGAETSVRTWIDTRRQMGIAGGTIFCSRLGAQMNTSYVRRILPRLSRTAGIKKRVHAHGLRHAFACNAHRARVSLRSLQLQLGHDSISTTSRYLERIGIDEVFAEFDRAFA